MKLRELFFLLSVYHSPEERYKLLSPLWKKITGFRRMVSLYTDQADNVGNLLRLCGMKRSTFEKRFKKEFSIPPYEYLLGQKAEQVKTALSNPGLSLGEVRKKCGFNSDVHFVRFCRRQFGMTGSQIRKSLVHRKATL